VKRFPKYFSKEIIELAELGKTPTEIARMLELNYVSVCGFMRKHGYRQPRPAVDNKDQIFKLFRLGLKPKEIATKLGINPITVNSFLNKNGLYSRPIVHNFNYFDTINTANKAYFVGFIAADGALVVNNNGSMVLTISLHKQDKEILEVFKQEIQCGHEVQELKQRNNSMVRIAFSNPTINSALLYYGITPRKSKTLGNILQYIPEPYKKAFIIGYFDGDGSIHKHSLNGKTVSIRGTKEFLEPIQQYLTFGKLIYSKTWVLKFHKHTEIRKFYSFYNYCDFFLKRKHEKFDECRTISSPYSSLNRG